MNGELPAGLAEKAKQKEAQDAAQVEAVKVALPGALREIFRKPQVLKAKVGGKEYSIRPFYDSDIEILQAFEHPVYKYFSGGFDFGGDFNSFRGKDSWILYWMLTRSADECDEGADKGKDYVFKEARKEFGRMQGGDLVEIAKVVFEQIGVYVSSLLVLAAPNDGEERTEVSKKNNS